MNEQGIKTKCNLVKSALANFTHFTLQKNLIAMDALIDCQIVNDQLKIDLCMPFAWNSGFSLLKQALTPQLLAMTKTTAIAWSLQYKIATLKRANRQPPVKNIKNIIAIGSGKGGVGKSTTAVNLALALQKEGAKVGMLDADIYGPSLPTMLGSTNEKPLSPDNQHMLAVMAFDMPTNSMGYLVDKDNAMVWRGPMASKALLQMANDTLWPALDYLIVDMPPGTGDIQLTLAQNMPVTGAVMVTTPQDIALTDAIKGLTMFNKVHVPTIGIIENMSYHICDNCGRRDAIFGEGGAKEVASRYNTQLLGQVPLHKSLRSDLDDGIPTVINQPDSAFTAIYSAIACRVATELYWQGTTTTDDIPIKML